jgi:hypothetical protein
MKRSVVGVLAIAVVSGLSWTVWNSAPGAEALQKDLESAYAAKLANPEYVAWKSRSGIPSNVQSFREEATIKAIRSELASRVSLPVGAEATSIPTVASAKPEIDGRIQASEWDRARSIGIGVDGSETELYMLSDGTSLYLACDVPDDTTGTGYDQFRFYVHIGLAPSIDNIAMRGSRAA